MALTSAFIVLTVLAILFPTSYYLLYHHNLLPFYPKPILTADFRSNSTNCTRMILETYAELATANLSSVDCSPLRLDGCDQIYAEIESKANHLSVFLRQDYQ